MLIDTNIIIELGKAQERSSECRDFFEAINEECFSENIYITEFTLRAIEALLVKANSKMVRDILLMIYQDKLKVFDMKLEDDLLILGALKDLKLDFDDATQFVATNKLGTYLVTFDKDFEKTGLQIKTPNEVLKEILV